MYLNDLPPKPPPGKKPRPQRSSRFRGPDDRAETTAWTDFIPRWKLARVLGFGALVAGGATVALSLLVIALLIGPLMFWLAWNVLDFGAAVGLPELGFWATILATLFLVTGWFGKLVIAGVVFLLNPDWFQAEAMLQWPEPTFKHFVALAILAVLAASPHARDHDRDKKKRKQATVIDVTVH